MHQFGFFGFYEINDQISNELNALWEGFKFLDVHEVLNLLLHFVYKRVEVLGDVAVIIILCNEIFLF